MIDFLADNSGTIAVSALLAASVILAVLKLYKDKKAGKNSCGGNCGSCPCSCGHSARKEASYGKNKCNEDN